MLKNIVKITLIILMMAPIGIAFTAHNTNHNNSSLQHEMVLAKGQYIMDSRHFKSADCCFC